MHDTRRIAFSILALSLAATGAQAHGGDQKILDKQPAYQGPGFKNVLKSTFARGGGQVELGSGTQFARSNVTLLSWMPLSDFGVGSSGNGNSCFGYVSPSGREYAIFGHSNGTAIIEISQPGNPVLVAQIPGPQSLWRDMRVYGAYAYAASEGGNGIQVINLTQVDNGIVTQGTSVTTGGSTATHTLAIDTDSGRLYRAGGGGNGLRIYDVGSNPAAPQYLGSWPDRYVHEAQVVTYPTGGPGGGPRQLAICCGGLNNGYDQTGIDIVDVTNGAAPVMLAHFSYGQPGYSHQAWLSPDRQFLFHNDEIDNRPFTRVFDASNLNGSPPTLPYLGEFQNGVSVDHNLYTKGSLIYESNYRSGLRVFDTSAGVTTPTLHAWFDTFPADNGGGYNGLWNNYPYFPSGVVIGSDLESGFFAWWVGTPQIEFTFPAGAPSALNPAGEAVTVQLLQLTPGILQAGSAKLYWSTGGAYTPVDLVPLSGDLYSAVFPSLPCGTNVSYYIAATSTNGIVWTSPESAPAQADTALVAFGATTVVTNDFETAGSGFVRDVAGDTSTSAGHWVRVNPNGTAAQSEDDHTPGAGVLCWVTGQGSPGGSVGEADVDTGRTTLYSSTYDLSAYASPVAGYWRWYVNDGNSAVDDSFRVDVTADGTTWVNVETLGPGHAEASGGWFYHQFDVTDFLAQRNAVRVRFVAEDIGSGSIVEAAIDDFAITDAVCTGYTAFCSGDGSGTDCPCGNTGAAGAGCANSTGASGLLAGSGAASVAGDTLSLDVSGLPSNVFLLYFQGTQSVNGGLGATFGDGLRCAGGAVVRLATKAAAGTTSSYPAGGDPSVSVRGNVAAGDTRSYQAWYRNAAAFCTGETFNLTNGLSVVWGS